MKLPKEFWDTRREKNMDQYTKTDYTGKTKKWRDKNIERKYLRVAATKKDTKSEEEYDSKYFPSDLNFMVSAAPDKVQANSSSATTSTSITEDSTIKGNFLPPVLGCKYHQLPSRLP